MTQLRHYDTTLAVIDQTRRHEPSATHFGGSPRNGCRNVVTAGIWADLSTNSARWRRPNPVVTRVATLAQCRNYGHLRALSRRYDNSCDTPLVATSPNKGRGPGRRDGNRGLNLSMTSSLSHARIPIERLNRPLRDTTHCENPAK